MAIFKQTYAPYAGPLAPRHTRVFVLARYGFARLFASRFLVLAIASCTGYPLACAAFIYVAHNPSFLSLLNVPSRGQFTLIDGRFFYYYCVVQGTMAYLLAALVAPGLIAPDLANGGLPLYLGRPLSRAEYVLGRAAVLLAVLSVVTWVPGVLLYAVQASLAGPGWVGSNLWLAWAIVAGLGTWVVVVTLVALALSAWVKWKIAAGALVLAVFFAGAGLAAAINSVLRTTSGSFVDLKQVVETVWSDLFRFDSGTDMPLGAAWAVLLAACAVSAGMLARRIRPFEVVR